MTDYSIQLGFAWTARVLGFINLGALSVCVALMRPRLPPRKSGPLIDWSAFKEPVWNVFIVGWWLVMWSNYYTFYYVSHLTHQTYSAGWLQGEKIGTYLIWHGRLLHMALRLWDYPIQPPQSLSSFSTARGCLSEWLCHYSLTASGL